MSEFDPERRPEANNHKELWTWFLAGVATAAFLIGTQAAAVGGLAGLLLVGEDSELRPFIEAQLGEVPLTSSRGHDGQIYFAIAHDLDGDEVGALIETPGIRFRRPVMPVLTSLGGLLTGRTVLWSTAFWIALGFGVSATAMRELTRIWGVARYWTLALFLYPGFWMATRLFTPDMIALACSLTGLVLFLRRRHAASILLFTVAALTKEVFLVIGLGISAWAFFEKRRFVGIATAAIPTATLIAYASAVIARFDVAAVDGNFGLPFTGIWGARDDWAFTTPSDRGYIFLTLFVLALSTVMLYVSQDRLLRWLIAPWPVIGIISSEWIWRIGNGTLRSFAPVVLFSALAIAHAIGNRGTKVPTTAESM
jgi:hypothetical protein